MSAIVTPPHILDKFDTLAPMSGDSLTRMTYGLMGIQRPAGQLWERVAETPSNAPAQLTARQDAGIVRAYAYAAIRAHRGPLARDPFSAASIQGVLSGVIHAGERIK